MGLTLNCVELSGSIGLESMTPNSRERKRKRRSFLCIKIVFNNICMKKISDYNGLTYFYTYYVLRYYKLKIKIYNITLFMYIF